MAKRKPWVPHLAAPPVLDAMVCHVAKCRDRPWRHGPFRLTQVPIGRQSEGVDRRFHERKICMADGLVLIQDRCPDIRHPRAVKTCDSVALGRLEHTFSVSRYHELVNVGVEEASGVEQEAPPRMLERSDLKKI